MKWKISLFIFLLSLILSPFVFIKYRYTRESSEIEKKPQYRIIRGYLSAGDCIIDILIENGLSPDIAYPVANKLAEVLDTRNLNIGDRYEIYFDKETDSFKKFVYYSGPIDIYTVSYDENNKISISTDKIKVEKAIVGAKGEINSSLYESMREKNIDPEIIIQFAEIFASKIDFFTDCQKGDTFSVLWESYKDEKGDILKNLRVVAGKYQNSHCSYYAFYFVCPDTGKGGYYDENGKSVETAFLKAPLNYRRISSYFSYRRFHPILKIYRPHLGIDYAAPEGTPISSIGDGVVLFAGWSNNGYGNYVKIKHPNGYITYYGHLSKIKKGIRKGVRVKKGQVIGYVGKTGLATGPHLDFRIKKNGKFINFLNLKLPPSYPLDKKYLSEFEKVKKEYLTKMKEL